MIENWKAKAKELKTEVYALAIAYRHPRTPWYAKASAALVIAYAFSPIDLIPDFIPIFGYLDDLILIPLGISFAIKMIPKDIMDESHEKAKESESTKPISWVGAFFVILVWILAIGALTIKFFG